MISGRDKRTPPPRAEPGSAPSPALPTRAVTHYSNMAARAELENLLRTAWRFVYAQRQVDDIPGSFRELQAAVDRAAAAVERTARS